MGTRLPRARRSRPWTWRALATAVALCAVFAATAVTRPAQPATAQPAIIERPAWAVGDWWEGTAGSIEGRLTVVSRHDDGYTLALSPRGVAVDNPAGLTTYRTDLDGSPVRMTAPEGKTTDVTVRYEWVKFPLKIGARWFFTTYARSTQGVRETFDYDARAERWEPIEIAGKRYQALRIAVTHRPRGSSNYFDLTAWYLPEAKRVVRLTPHYARGPRIDVTAFGSATPAVVAAGPPPRASASTPAPPPGAAPSPASVASIPTPTPGTPAGGSRRNNAVAVVIGVGAYDSSAIPRLRYAVPDAEAVARVLIEHVGVSKERVMVLTDGGPQRPTLRNIKSALGTFLARNATRDDTVLVFFAGHGAPEIDPRGAERDGFAKYLVPSDADPDDLYATALSMDEMHTIFSRIEAERVVVFVDACYSGAVGGRTFVSRRAAARNILVDDGFLARLAHSKGRAIITASRPSEVSLELAELGHGIFTYYVVEGLKGAADLDRDGIVTLQELYVYVEREVSRKSRAVGGNQHPVLKGEFEGPFPLVLLKPR